LTIVVKAFLIIDAASLANMTAGSMELQSRIEYDGKSLLIASMARRKAILLARSNTTVGMFWVGGPCITDINKHISSADDGSPVFVEKYMLEWSSVQLY
jgi:hypothetical protein